MNTTDKIPAGSIPTVAVEETRLDRALRNAAEWERLYSQAAERNRRLGTENTELRKQLVELVDAADTATMPKSHRHPIMRGPPVVGGPPPQTRTRLREVVAAAWHFLHRTPTQKTENKANHEDTKDAKGECLALCSSCLRGESSSSQSPIPNPESLP